MSNETTPPDLTFIRLKDVSRRTTYSRSRIYELIQLGKFPKPIQLGDRAVAWTTASIDEWMQARITASRLA